MAEFVRDDSLQLIPVEDLEGTPGDGDGRVAGREAGCKCVDPAFFLEDVNLGDRHAGRDSHLLDNIAQPAPQRVAGIGSNVRATHLPGHGTTSRGKRRSLEHARANNEERCQQRRGDQDSRVIGGKLAGCIPIAGVSEREKRETDDERDARDDKACSQDIRAHQSSRRLACLILCGEKVHVAVNSVTVR